MTIAIDSPAAAGAGTQAKYLSKEYNLLYLDTGKIYRYIGKVSLRKKNKFNYNFLRKKIKFLNIKDLNQKDLLNDDVATAASILAKDTKIRDMVKFPVKMCI